MQKTVIYIDDNIADYENAISLFKGLIYLTSQIALD